MLKKLKFILYSIMCILVLNSTVLTGVWSFTNVSNNAYVNEMKKQTYLNKKSSIDRDTDSYFEDNENNNDIKSKSEINELPLPNKPVGDDSISEATNQNIPQGVEDVEYSDIEILNKIDVLFRRIDIEAGSFFIVSIYFQNDKLIFDTLGELFRSEIIASVLQLETIMTDIDNIRNIVPKDAIGNGVPFIDTFERLVDLLDKI